MPGAALVCGTAFPRQWLDGDMSWFKRITARVKGSEVEEEEGAPVLPAVKGVILNFPSGQIQFSDEEAGVYTKLALVLDVEGDDQISGRIGASFLRRSRLPTDMLREVWRLACGGKSKVRGVADAR